MQILSTYEHVEQLPQDIVLRVVAAVCTGVFERMGAKTDSGAGLQKVGVSTAIPNHFSKKSARDVIAISRKILKEKFAKIPFATSVISEVLSDVNNFMLHIMQEAQDTVVQYTRFHSADSLNANG